MRLEPQIDQPRVVGDQVDLALSDDGLPRGLEADFFNVSPAEVIDRLVDRGSRSPPTPMTALVEGALAGVTHPV